MDTQRKLAEYVNGVQVTRTSSMSDLTLEDDRVSTMLKDVVLKNAIEVGEPRYEDEYSTCKVTMELRLYGGKSSLSEAAYLPFKDENKIAFPPPIDTIIINQPSVHQQQLHWFDCRLQWNKHQLCNESRN